MGKSKELKNQTQHSSGFIYEDPSSFCFPCLSLSMLLLMASQVLGVLFTVVTSEEETAVLLGRVQSWHYGVSPSFKVWSSFSVT